MAHRIWSASLVLILSCITAGAQQPEFDRAAALHGPISQLVAAARNGDSKQLEEMLDGFILPEPQSFFSHVFGEEEGAKLAANYAGQSNLKQRLAQDLREMAKGDPAKLEISMTKHDSPDGSGLNDFWRAVLRQRHAPEPLYSAAYRVGKGSWHALAEFFQMHDRFAIVNNQTFTGLSGVPPMRLRVGGNVMSQSSCTSPSPSIPKQPGWHASKEPSACRQ
jgi:hypothetical protein